VISSIDEPGGTFFGYPARPLKEERRDAMRVKQLGNLMKRVKDLEARLGESDG
jgi:UDP-3-O-[3-hydroxymyristoyl] glucosamine N-acyltransferase